MRLRYALAWAIADVRKKISDSAINGAAPRNFFKQAIFRRAYMYKSHQIDSNTS
ncbi:asl5072 [Nostoc sp. PCC 7120 = FACHB-418]|nr:asl5072 [Nostoc sp. PCC 7120 = FACHB-418]